LAIFILAFARALSASKGLQAALALVQEVQEVAWLQKKEKKKELAERNSSNDTYSKF